MIFFQKKLYSAEKCKRGDSFGFINIHSVAKFQKTRRGKNFLQKSRTVPKKIQKGDPLGTSGFVVFLEKVQNERGALCTKFDLALGGFRNVSKEWTDQCEDCSLKKKREKGSLL